MRISPNAVVWMVIMISCASLVGKVVHVLSVDVISPDFATKHSQDSVEGQEDEDKERLGAQFEHLFWFIQISDLHLSVFHDGNRVSHLRQFCSTTLDAIRPYLVLASGDLTDAKASDMLGSKQFIEEWETYKDILDTTKVAKKTVWLDIRGNHDNFNVASLDSADNFYQKYSIQGKTHSRSYMYTTKHGEDSYAFIAVDACLLPGPRRPFNFIGVLPASEMKLLQEFEYRSRSYNYTIWFGHYPTSCILSPEPGIRKLMGSGMAYLCGHLHTLGGFVPNMYTRQHTGALELELADWKDNRRFRVAAVDHGLFSFTDVSHGEWPVILVTNPKHGLFTMPHHEPVGNIRQSSHVRVLVWSVSPVVEVQLRFDDSDSWVQLTHVEGPLYVTPWNVDNFIEGVHTLEVFARDSGGRESFISQPFSVDGSQISFGLLPRALLMSNVSMVFQFLFGMIVCVCVIPLCIIRYMHHLVLEGRFSRPRMSSHILNIWLRKFWVLAGVDCLFWPIVLSSIYMPFGPWFIGEVLEGHIGVVFAWGTFVNKSYLPGSLTYAYGFFQMLTFQLPLFFAVAHCVDCRFMSLYVGGQRSLLAYVWKHLCILSLITMQVILAYCFYLAYGTMALILGPMRTWAALFGILFWYKSTTLTKDKLRNVAKVWCCVPAEEPCVVYKDIAVTIKNGKVYVMKKSQVHHEKDVKKPIS